MESKDIMELVDRIILLTEENAQMRERIGRLSEAVITEERRDAQYSVEHGYSYSANLRCDEINLIMGWKRDEEAERILNAKKEESDEG